MGRIGIFGGTFNPPHVVHVKMVEEAIKQLNFEKVLIIPTYCPPHKEPDGSLSPESRLDMAKLAFENIPKTEVSDMEILREGMSYTYDTICKIEDEYKSAELFVIIGEDMLESLASWYRAEELMRKVQFLVFDRGGYNADIERIAAHLKKRYRAKILISSMPPIEKSSTEIRKYGVREDVPPSVEQYIKENRLYEKKTVDRKRKK